jgi:hypothetical protein
MKLYVNNPINRYSKIIDYIGREYNIYQVSIPYKLYRSYTMYDKLYNNIFNRSDDIMRNIKNISNSDKKVIRCNINDMETIPLLSRVLPKDIHIELDIDYNVMLYKSEFKKIIEYGIEELVSENYSRIILINQHTRFDYIEKMYDIGFRQFKCTYEPIYYNYNKFRYNMDERLEEEYKRLHLQNLKKIEELDRRFCGELEIIGGPVRNKQEIEQYRWSGSEHIACDIMSFIKLV